MGHSQVPQFPNIHYTSSSVYSNIWGVQVSCSEIEINEILGCTYPYQNDLEDIMQLKKFDDIKAWLAPMIGISAPLWLEKGAIIEKNEMNIPVRFWFGFFSSNLMPS